MSDDHSGAFIEAGCRLLGISVRDEWRETIRLHLALSLDHARHVGEFELPDEAEPAPVFAA
jgi:Protein of unknown function (DUF4089)